MRFAAAIVVAGAGIVAAQTTTTAATGSSSTSSCQAENIVQACLASTGTTLAQCSSQDYQCLCAAYQSQLTCYNNCPDDVNRSSAQAQVTAFCNAASAQSSQSAATATTQSSSASSGSASSTASTTTTSESTSTTGSATGATTSSTSKGLAAPVAVPAGSLLAVALGLFGLM